MIIDSYKITKGTQFLKPFEYYQQVITDNHGDKLQGWALIRERGKRAKIALYEAKINEAKP